MSQLGFVIINLILMILSSSKVSSAPTSSDENTMKDLYDYILQREYAEPLSLDPHEMERKAVRSPSMRLRFGRIDPSVSMLRKDNYIENEIQSKPIRSPSMRLRFGRRSDPMMPILFEDSYGNEAMARKYQRTPSVRLRFGKRSSPIFNDDEDNNSLHNDDAVAQMMNHTQDN